MEAWTRKPLAQFAAARCVMDYEDYDDEMRAAMREVGVRNMMIERRLHELLRLLEERRLPAIVMKGCHLMQTVYPFGIRPIEDIDILIDRNAYAAADEAVRSLGYADRAFGMDVWTHVEVSNKMTYMNESQPVIPIDMHFTLGPYPYLGRIPFDVLMAHTERIQAKDMEYLVLRTEMLLVHLCLHLFQHRDEHWQVSAYDLQAVSTLQGHTIDWDSFSSIVIEYSLQLPVLYSLKLARELADIHVPSTVIDKLAAVPATRRELRIFHVCMTMSGGMDKHVIQWMTLPTLTLKLKCITRIIFPRHAFLQHYFNNSYAKYAAALCRTAARSLFSALVRRPGLREAGLHGSYRRD